MPLLKPITAPAFLTSTVHALGSALGAGLAAAICFLNRPRRRPPLSAMDPHILRDIGFDHSTLVVSEISKPEMQVFPGKAVNPTNEASSRARATSLVSRLPLLTEPSSLPTTTRLAICGEAVA